MVFHCYWDTAFVYVFAQFFGAAIAAALVLPLYGFGQFGSLFDTRVFSWLGLSVPRHLAEVNPLASAAQCMASASPMFFSS